MDTNLQIRISKDIKESFQQIAKENNKDTSSLVRDWISNYIAEHQRSDEEVAAELYMAGYKLQEALGGRENVNKEFVKQLQEYSLTNQKEFTQLILTTYLDLDLTIPSCVSKTYKMYAFSQMFLFGLIGDKPKER
ncbi:ribbon-helix-helix protein, CopG family [Paenibacillus endoradicis]|uniref:ribbon-helix-helix protein, CopG family n=1 Tax=Paenibacillus endoradicis TaxID=2972487 RepID=UPI0021593335|nr:ribbon-helix-helix protein, CopG family [Paenibacillus endoradicis]MCR8656908.1 ribbon-helix-helix protein, CopG family [Paenibacillus endoradicis]